MRKCWGRFESKWQCTDHNADGFGDPMMHQLCTHDAPFPDCAHLLCLCRSQLQRARDTSSKTIDSIKAELDMHQQALSDLEDQKIRLVRQTTARFHRERRAAKQVFREWRLKETNW